jgi:hypothetical protein
MDAMNVTRPRLAALALLLAPSLLAAQGSGQLAIERDPGRLYVGATIAHRVVGVPLDSVAGLVTWRSNDPRVATVDAFGLVTAQGRGFVEISAELRGAVGVVRHVVVVNPVTRIEMRVLEAVVPAGQPVQLRATPRRADGNPVEDAPLLWAYAFTPYPGADSVAAPARITGDRFVAMQPGRYTLIAISGGVVGRQELVVRPPSP